MLSLLLCWWCWCWCCDGGGVGVGGVGVGRVGRTSKYWWWLYWCPSWLCWVLEFCRSLWWVLAGTMVVGMVGVAGLGGDLVVAGVVRRAEVSAAAVPGVIDGGGDGGRYCCRRGCCCCCC